MPGRQVDPARLEGEELRQWYLRSRQEVEQDRRDAEARKHAQFVASIQENEREPEGDAASPLDKAAEAFRNWQNGPKIPRPNLGESFVPVLGPSWEAVADFQDGNYRGAGFNILMAGADLLPLGVAVKGAKAASKGVKIFKEGSLTANASASRLRDWGIAKKKIEEIHHTIPLNGIKRDEQNWRNHYAFLKILPKETHRRLTGKWEGKARFDPVRRVWYGTTDWQKAVPTGVAGYLADGWENVTRPFSTPGATSKPPSR